jgi:uncharacterized C2H2 Zn-finger protein
MAEDLPLPLCADFRVWLLKNTLPTASNVVSYVVPNPRGFVMYYHKVLQCCGIVLPTGNAALIPDHEKQRHIVGDLLCCTPAAAEDQYIFCRQCVYPTILPGMKAFKEHLEAADGHDVKNPKEGWRARFNKAIRAQGFEFNAGRNQKAEKKAATFLCPTPSCGALLKTKDTLGKHVRKFHAPNSAPPKKDKQPKTPPRRKARAPLEHLIQFLPSTPVDEREPVFAVPVEDTPLTVDASTIKATMFRDAPLPSTAAMASTSMDKQLVLSSDEIYEWFRDEIPMSEEFGGEPANFLSTHDSLSM